MLGERCSDIYTSPTGNLNMISILETMREDN
jgi:hypothetical protein